MKRSVTKKKKRGLTLEGEIRGGTMFIFEDMFDSLVLCDIWVKIYLGWSGRARGDIQKVNSSWYQRLEKRITR